MLNNFKDVRTFLRDAKHWQTFTDAVWTIRTPVGGGWSGYEYEDELWESDQRGNRVPVDPAPLRSFAFVEGDPRLVGSRLHDVAVDGEHLVVGIFDSVHTDFSAVTYANIVAGDGVQVSVPVIDWVEEDDDEPKRIARAFARPVPARL